jgi:hypothetical protein
MMIWRVGFDDVKTASRSVNVNSGETVVGSGRESTQGEGEGEEIKQDNKSGVTIVVTKSER